MAATSGWVVELPVASTSNAFQQAKAVLATGTLYQQFLKNSPQLVFTSQAAAQAYAKQVNGVTALSSDPITAAEQAAQGKTSNAAGATVTPDPLTSIASFVGNLGQPATWIRVAKVIVGGALLLIGIAHMSGASSAVAQAARKVPLPI